MRELLNERLQFYGPCSCGQSEGEGLGAEKYWVLSENEESVFMVSPSTSTSHPRKRPQQRWVPAGDVRPRPLSYEYKYVKNVTSKDTEGLHLLLGTALQAVRACCRVPQTHQAKPLLTQCTGVVSWELGSSVAFLTTVFS